MEKLFQKLPKNLQMIHAFYGGSSLHGAKIGTSSDTDIYGVFLEPIEQSLGLDCFEHFCTSTAGDDVRNSPTDVDINTYSLRMWAGLACKGNPTALEFLFASNALPRDEYTWFWQAYREEFRQAVVCKKAGKAFLGYANDQMRRLAGTKGLGKHGQRPEVIEKYGYDTKAAMHVMRLLDEGSELMRFGRMTFPLPDRDFLISVRQGGYTNVESFLDAANSKFAILEEDMEHSALPERPDRAELNRLVVEIYADFYGMSM